MELRSFSRAYALVQASKGDESKLPKDDFYVDLCMDLLFEDAAADFERKRAERATKVRE